MNSVSIQEIANALNLSRITVSKALNNKDGVSLETKKLVLQKAYELDYKKINPELLKLIGENGFRINKNILIIATEPMKSEFWTDIINGIAKETEIRQYNLIHKFLSFDEEFNFKIPKVIEQKQIQGIILINFYNKQGIKNLSELGIPMAILDMPILPKTVQLNTDIFLFENYKTVFDITNKMIKNGFKKLSFIGDLGYSKNVLERYNGFVRANSYNNIEINHDMCMLSSPSDRYLFAQELDNFLKSLKVMPNGFVCANDYIANFVIDFAHNKKLVLSKDYMVSGFDDVRQSLVDKPILTTVSVNRFLLGKRIAKQIFMRIESPSMPFETITVNSKVAFRQSTEHYKII